MFKIYISYRREDEQASAANLIRNELNQHWGGDHVWLDISDIPAAASFEEEMARDIASSDFVFVLINNKWVKTTKLRENTPDFVRLEIEVALREKIPLVPLLIDNVSLPEKGMLPKSISRLIDFQAFRINPLPYSIEFDIGKILSYLENRYSEKVTNESGKRQVYVKEDALKVFINYRRKDSQSDAGRIFERLEAYYGRGNVFIDVDSIPISVDFRDHINLMIGMSDVVLVLIGSNWLKLLHRRKPTFMRKLFSQGTEVDWVQTEIISAFNQGKTIVPVLLGHFPMPAPELLPVTLRQITFINGQIIDPGIDFNYHINRLIQRLDSIQAGKNRK